MAALFQYQKLKPEEGLDFVGDHEHHYKFRFRPILQRSSSRVWAKLRMVHIRRRLRLRVPGLRKFLRTVHIRRRLRLRALGLRRLLRQKTRLVAAAVRETVRRLKKGQGYLGDLFVGNYLFLQVSPSTPATMQKCAIERPIPSSRFSATYKPSRQVTG